MNLNRPLNQFRNISHKNIWSIPYFSFCFFYRYQADGAVRKMRGTPLWAGNRNIYTGCDKIGIRPFDWDFCLWNWTTFVYDFTEIDKKFDLYDTFRLAIWPTFSGESTLTLAMGFMEKFVQYDGEDPMPDFVTLCNCSNR